MVKYIPTLLGNYERFGEMKELLQEEFNTYTQPEEQQFAQNIMQYINPNQETTTSKSKPQKPTNYESIHNKYLLMKQN